ncbi:MAG TPA: ABC transporter ATP-binding protein [Dehalococcoidia bacterium]|nr:ABC transporter ATP-binding protein [Dehalococcoidia bacterium]
MSAPAVRADDVVLTVDSLSKKFCRDLRRSLAYGFKEILAELAGLRRPAAALREREFWALHNVTFELRRGEALGLVGANGAGKTTLLRVISGVFRPDGGTVRVRGRVAPLLALGTGFHPLLTGRENVYVNMAMLGLSRRQIDERVERVVDFAEIGEAIDAPVRTYSSGMQARLGFSCAIHIDPEILLIDEVLAVGDIRFRRKCYRRLAEMRAAGTAFILVSHNPNVIRGTCDRALYLRRGRLDFIGDVQTAIRRYEEDLFVLAEQAKPRNASTTAEDEVQIVDFFVEDARGRRSDSMVSGAPASFCIRCQARRDISRAEITAIIREMFGDRDDTVVMSTGLEPLSIPSGASEIRIELPYCGLRAGRYTVKLGITEGPLQHLGAVEAFHFQVAPTEETQQGLFYQPHVWKIRALGAVTTEEESSGVS